MKVAVSAHGPDLSAPVEVRFGRAPGFVIVDTESGNVEHVDNREAAGAGQGAGIQAARRMAEHGVQVVLTGHCGPNAFRALSAAGIKIYNTEAPTVAGALEQFRSGKLAESASADVEGHWA